MLRRVLQNYEEGLHDSHVIILNQEITPLSVNAFFNDKTLDYLFDNQAFVKLSPLSISIKINDL